MCSRLAVGEYTALFQFCPLFLALSGLTSYIGDILKLVVRGKSENTQGLLRYGLETKTESLPVSSHGPGEVT